MANKKAIILTALVAIIIAIIVGMFIMLIFGNIAEASGAGTMVDSMCRFNTGLIAGFSSTGKGLLPLLFCPERTVTIDATDWSKCNAELYKSNIDRGRDYCAAQQILTLADRCWYMYGDGKKSIAGMIEAWRGGSCFKFKVKNLPKTSGNGIDDKVIAEVAGENINPRTDQNYCKSFDCVAPEYNGAPMTRIAWPIEKTDIITGEKTPLKIKSSSGYWRIMYSETNKDVAGQVTQVVEFFTGKKFPLLAIAPA